MANERAQQGRHGQNENKEFMKKGFDIVNKCYTKGDRSVRDEVRSGLKSYRSDGSKSREMATDGWFHT